MDEKVTLTREDAKLAITSLVESDREKARSTLKKVLANIKGAHIVIQWRRGRPYYYLYKTYYFRGFKIPKCLLYYGVRPPRGAK